MKAFINGRIIGENEILEDHIILFEKSIKEILPKDEFIQSQNIEIIDLEGKYISPGFIDIHIHGAGGSDTMDGTLRDLEIISKTIGTTGVTSFLPTTMTMGKDRIYKALDRVREAMNKKMPGAKVLGAHMEGPFISEKFKGAQNPKFIIKPQFEFIKDYLDVIKIITLAPEEDEKFSFIQQVGSIKDMVLSMGHTNINYERALQAIEKGISHGTHLFNAMTPLHHREPGAVGAALQSEITCELIADTIHVHPALLDFVIKTKGLEKVILVTDSMRAGCLREGNYDLGGQKVVVDDKSARLEDGTLAGSILTMNGALKNILQSSPIKLWEAIGLLSLNPAKKLNIHHKKGSIIKGKDADLCILDEAYNVFMTLVEGEIVYSSI
ncbi:N-acetylglucosamine-6-phosphate deacetylase [Irregularibacter muris]|uniref:N-acetylglucosamine-6-phosphate deacetylase n=1 Tax=Irregularibacter muris TaxID=1796619 RepID=A0AAE3HEZ8_9FIRM|nr:N-acetylglucosamine-6-phosphate deacetylase [Irregularibacter muris]MCR1898297.1 N-acetylglucosamine-6-phosphate deacetylase [Irregularibacter muris]